MATLGTGNRERWNDEDVDRLGVQIPALAAPCAATIEADVEAAQVRRRSILRDDRATPVEAVDQGGHDGLNEELVTVKETVGQASRDNPFRAIGPVILGEAILGLPGEVGDPAALILDAAAKEPT